MAINSRVGVLRKEILSSRLRPGGAKEAKLLQVGTAVRYYRHPLELGCYVIEGPGSRYARIEARTLREYIEE